MTAMTMTGGAIRINEKGISMRTSNTISLGKNAKATIAGLSAILLATTAAPAFAQEESSSAITVSGNAAVTSDYRFRGLSFSDGDIAIQGGIDVSHESGFYIGTWGSSIEDSATFGHTELDLYGGWSGEVTSGLTLDVGLLYFFYPNGEDGAAGPSDYFEPYASVSATVGPVDVTSGIAYAWSQDSLGNSDNVYIYTGVSAGIPDTPITLNANIGINEGSLGNPAGVLGANDYVDWMLGVDWAITDNLTATLAYTDTDAPAINNFTDSAIVFTLGVSF
ncbi:MAG: TorF family putative porin [Parasphingorhabdus sp.]|uniref:TorF family putative porin n=1 Tax=Parasphingorhabdus sp. TaxID=2709688 RepID=UPI0032663133